MTAEICWSRQGYVTAALCRIACQDSEQPWRCCKCGLHHAVPKRWVQLQQQARRRRLGRAA